MASSSKSIAILGGGIGGLSAAYYILEKAIRHGINLNKVYLLEEQSRFGGWLKTKYIGDKEYFELGPRTISLSSYAGINVISLVNSIGLDQEVKFISKKSEAFKKRYIAIDNQLRLLPTGLGDLFTYKSPFKPFIFYLMKDLREPPVKLNKSNDDISVHDFFNKRFGPEVASYLVNSLCIGITGGDSHELSMRSVFSGILQKEQTYGSVVKGMFKHKEDIFKELKYNNLVKKSIDEKWAVFSFDKGIETLPNRLSFILNNDYNKIIHLLTNTKVTDIRFEKDQTVLNCDNQQKISVDHLFSSIPAIKLAPLLSKENVRLKESLSSIRTVHMAVVCLQYKHHIIPPDKGFGFLVPSNQNSDILGVTFDSCMFPSKSTKVTVMLGGYRFEKLFGTPDKVDKNQLLEISLKAMESFLNIKETPICHYVAIHQDCIPQYTVGHQSRLRMIENEIQNLPLSLLGASYYGFSVPDIILNAKIQANNWIENQTLKR